MRTDLSISRFPIKESDYYSIEQQRKKSALRGCLKKIFWFDSETTGTEHEKHAIVQLSGFMEIGSNHFEEFDLHMKPWEGAEIDPQALSTNNYTVDQIMEFPDPSKTLEILKNSMSRYVNKFDKKDKFVPAGYNTSFDINMLRSSFEHTGDKYFGSWFFWPVIDVKNLVAKQIVKGLRLPNYQLETVCEYYGIEINAHDALSDIKATRELYLKLESLP